MKKPWYRLGRLRELRFHSVVLLTLVPGLLLPTLFVASVADFYKLNVALTEPARRLVNQGRAVEYYLQYKLQSLPNLLTHNERAETIIAERRWANDELHIDIPQVHWEAMLSELPGSPDTYQKMNIWGEGKYKKAAMRFRGDSGFHWLLPKKSFKLKTSKGELYRGHRRLNFTIKYPYMGTLVGLIARDFDLLSPEGDPVKTFVNNQFYGIHRFIEDVDEGFLRANSRMPGDIYKGEGLRATGDWHAGLLGHFLLYSPYVWPKVAIDNSRPDNHREELVRLSRLLATPGRDANIAFTEHFDRETIVRNIAFNFFTNEWHSGDGNNMRWYVDPTDGRFHPIIWDGYAGSNAKALADDPQSRTLLNHGFYRMGSDPRLMHDVFAYLYTRFQNPDLIERHCAPLREHIEANAQAFEVEALHTTFGLSKEKFEKVCNALAGNRDRILGHLVDATVEHTRLGPTWVLATRSLAGAVVRAVVVEGDMPEAGLRVELDRDGDLRRSPDDEAVAVRVESVAKNRHRIAFEAPIRVLPAYAGRNRLRPDRLEYGVHLPAGLRVVGVEAENAITGAVAKANATPTWPRIAQDTLHPWSLPAIPVRKTIELDHPVHRIDEDWIVPEHATVMIRPGTTVEIAEGATIRSFGRIVAQGTAEQPIAFTHQQDGTVWGVLALQGSGASGSRFEHVHFEHGSLARFGATRYPGMVTVHRADDVLFQDCVFSNNLVGDDLFRAAHSTVDIRDSRFFAANSDAIDYDYSKGTITRNHFENVGNDCIDLMTSSPDIVENTIEGCGDKGISVGEKSFPLVFNNLISHAEVGIQVKDGSDPLILHDTIARCKVGIHAYRKNWRYDDGGRGRVVNSEIVMSDRALKLEGRSGLIVEASIVQGLDPGAAPPSRLTLRRSSVPEKGRPTNDHLEPDRSVYARFEPITFEPQIGRVEKGARLSRAPVVDTARFQDGFHVHAPGWELDRGAKLYIEGKTLKAELRTPETTLTRTLNEPAGRTESRVVLQLSASEPSDIEVELVGETSTRHTLHADRRMALHPLPTTGQPIKAIRLRSDHPTTVRIESLDVVAVSDARTHR